MQPKKKIKKREVESANASGTQALTLRGLSNPRSDAHGSGLKKREVESASLAVQSADQSTGSPRFKKKEESLKDECASRAHKRGGKGQMNGIPFSCYATKIMRPTPTHIATGYTCVGVWLLICAG